MDIQNGETHRRSFSNLYLQDMYVDWCVLLVLSRDRRGVKSIDQRSLLIRPLRRNTRDPNVRRCNA